MAARLAVRIFAMGVLAALAWGCDKDKTNPSVPEEGPGAIELRESLLERAGMVVSDTYSEADSLSAELVEALENGDRDEQRTKFHALMDVWQRAETMIVGPAGAMGDVAGGQDLRDSIYSWPLSNACRVDQEVLAQNYTMTDGLRSQPVPARGLDALEYLLYVETRENACRPNLSINTSGDWAALDDSEIESRRAAYALRVGQLVAEDIGALSDAWGEDGAFRSEFVSPDSGDTYRSTREALNALSDALFYLEKEVKDMKLAPPSGVSECIDPVCPDRRESLFANRSLDNVRSNLDGFESLFFGDDRGPGFFELLKSVSAEDTAQAMEESLASVRAALGMVDGTMQDSLARGPDEMRNLHDVLRDLSTLLKTEFVTVLDLDLPQRAEGDND